MRSHSHPRSVAVVCLQCRKARRPTAREETMAHYLPPERAKRRDASFVSPVISQPAAAPYIQPPMFDTIVAIQSIANTRYRNASSSDALVERFSTATTLLYLAAGIISSLTRFPRSRGQNCFLWGPRSKTLRPKGARSREMSRLRSSSRHFLHRYRRKYSR